MAGFFDTLFGGTPDQQRAIGLLGAGLVRGDFAGGATEAMGLLAGAEDRALKRKLLEMDMEARRMEVDKAKRAAANEQGLTSLMPQYFNAGTQGRPGTEGVNAGLPPEFQIGAQAPISARAPQFDVKGFTAAAVQNGYMNPLDAIKLQKSLTPESQINKLDVKDFTPASVARFNQTGNYADLERMDKLHFADTGGAVAGINPFTGKPVNAVPKTGNPYSDLLVSDGQGGMRPNSPLISAKSQIAKAGASTNNISVNTEKSLLNEVAGGLGKAVTDARGNAQGALGTINTVNRLMDALDSGQVMAGPGTTFRQAGLQVGNLLGVTGKDANEKLLNTRQAIQSLAQLELDAAQQMKGQGQITEAERAIIRRAASGDIDGMTVPELRLLGGVLDRTARFKIRGYNQQAAPLRNNPNAAPIAPFLEVQEPEQRQGAAGVRKYNPATGRIE